MIFEHYLCDNVTKSEVLVEFEHGSHFADDGAGHVADVPAGGADEFGGFEFFDEFAVDVGRDLTEDLGDDGLPRGFRAVVDLEHDAEAFFFQTEGVDAGRTAFGSDVREGVHDRADVVASADEVGILIHKGSHAGGDSGHRGVGKEVGTRHTEIGFREIRTGNGENGDAAAVAAESDLFIRSVGEHGDDVADEPLDGGSGLFVAFSGAGESALDEDAADVLGRAAVPDLFRPLACGKSGDSGTFVGGIARLHDEVVFGDAGLCHEGLYNVGTVDFAGVGARHDGTFIIGQTVYFVEAEQENGQRLNRFGGRTEEIVVGIASGGVFDAAFGDDAHGTAVDVLHHSAAGFGCEDHKKFYFSGKTFLKKSFPRAPFKKLSSGIEDLDYLHLLYNGKGILSRRGFYTG